MGYIRTVKRSVAKGRLSAMGVGSINKKMKLKKEKTQNWKPALYGKTGEDAHRAQMNLGQLIKAKGQGKAVRSKRKLEKVTE